MRMARMVITIIKPRVPDRMVKGIGLLKCLANLFFKTV